MQNDELKKFTLQSFPFWVSSIVAGLLAVFYSKLFHWVEQLHEMMNFHKAWWVFLAAPASFFLAWWLVHKFSPTSSGSGIPQLLAGIHFSGQRSGSANVLKLLNVKVIFIKIISSITLLLGGGANGREGPTIQISGAIFNTIYRFVPDFWPKINQRLMLISGGAAGLAAAFNTPLGGIVFAIEELGKTHLNAMRTHLFTAVIIAGLTSQLFLGSYLYIGTPFVPEMKGMAIVYVMLTAVFASFFGYLFSSILLKIIRWKKVLKHTRQKAAWAILMGLVFATLVFFTGNATTGSGKTVMVDLLFNENATTDWFTFPSRFFASIITYISGGAGGIFAPSLSIGATLGDEIVNLLGVPEFKNLIIITAMIAFMTGVTHAPFTSFILVLEMTNRHNSVFSMMLAALIAISVAKLLHKKSFYEQLVEDYLKSPDFKPKAEKNKIIE
ncbi:MAG TPA: chloride channel protein [Vicingaceae bacterium]|nr:chloride channel protein [Vicingaceae bacterium]